MEPEQNQKNNTKNEDENFMLEEQINIYRNQLPQVSRGDSNFFFKQVVRDESDGITYIQIGFRVATVGPNIYDTVNMVINQIHCMSQDNLKLILDGQQLWVTSSIVYPEHLLGDLSYNITEAHYKQSLLKAQQILSQVVERCRIGFQKMQADQQLLKAIRQIAKNLQLAFKDPNQP